MDEATWLAALQTGNEDALQWYALVQASKLANTPATLAIGAGGVQASAGSNTLILVALMVGAAFFLLR